MSALHDMFRYLTNGGHWTGSNGIPHLLVQHLGITGMSVGIAALVAIPAGLVLGHTGRGGFLAVNLANIGRAVPTLAVLALFALWPLVGIGDRNAVTALVLFAVPPLLTNTYVGMRGVDADVKEAARGMGMRGRQIALRVEAPLAAPLIAAGVRTAAVQVVATATLAAEVGAGGLGQLIVQGNATANDGEYLSGALVVILLAVAVELSLAAVQRRIGRRRAAVGPRVAGPAGGLATT